MIKYAHIIRCVTEEIHKKAPNKQVGKTLLQKMFYLLTRKGIIDLDYKLYHYGPYSREVERSLEKASNLGLVKIDWRASKGYYIQEIEKQKEIEKKTKREIRKIVANYKDFTANELSIITTALYVVAHYKITSRKDLIDQILSLKPNNTRMWVKKTLIKGEGSRIVQDALNI